MQGEPNAHQLRAGIEPFSKTNTPKPSDLALMTDPRLVVVITSASENDQVSQFIGSQTQVGPSVVNSVRGSWWEKM